MRGNLRDLKTIYSSDLLKWFGDGRRGDGSFHPSLLLLFFLLVSFFIFLLPIILLLIRLCHDSWKNDYMGGKNNYFPSTSKDPVFFVPWDENVWSLFPCLVT